ncbi:MAG: 30S ribosome-binding factor RbfA [Thermoanaerobaculaceae bacterium]|nr:30S ribosome-binding factor RbfA [Thermoanaerobaculaceae bacterium]MDI9620915.1 30S ribosome-binding factor RbfA [Acidobacteriota bacterium]NLH12419.1 30S ribosome-binding factor RbfA [Holophagae bacterium]HPW56801.1 30S ribosome-binding factor RbfA [Thermoanaerobaculaceae bacterium]
MRDARLRPQRLAEAIRETLSELLLRESKDPRLHGVVISGVELSGDLKQARAFFSVYGDEERERQALDGLHQAKAFLRRQMGRRMRLHNPPNLEFRRDKGYERADRVARILAELDLPPAEGEVSPGDAHGSPPASSTKEDDRHG